MEQEISLVRSVRARICPELERTAEAANARDQLYAPLDSFDYAAWNHCRRAAEEQLGRSQAPLFRNHQGFVFYTIQGARFAEQADHLHASFKALGCE